MNYSMSEFNVGGRVFCIQLSNEICIGKVEQKAPHYGDAARSYMVEFDDCSCRAYVVVKGFEGNRSIFHYTEKAYQKAKDE